MRYLLTIWAVIQSALLYGQSAQYSAPESACIDEVVEFQNTSTDALSFEWDFCLSDFNEGDESINTQVSIPTLDNVYGNWIGEDNGNWYGFIISNRTNSLYRLDYGADPTTLATDDVVEIGNPQDNMGTPVFDNPGRLDIINYNGDWYGVVGYTNFGGELTLLEFGNSLTNTPVASSLGNFGLNRLWDVKLAIQDGDIILLMALLDGSRIYRVNYEDSFASSSSTVFTEITGMLNPVGIDIVKYENEWHLIAARLSSSEIYHYNFGSDLMTDGSVSNTFNLTLSSPNAVRWYREGDIFIAGISNGGAGGLTMVDFKDLSVGITPDERIISSVERTRAIHGLRYNGTSIFSIVNNNLEVLNISYEKNCNQSVGYSTEVSPSITFGAAGDYPVELRAITNDSVSVFTDTVSILSQVAPTISFTSENVCISSLINFTPSNTGLTLYEWDFDGDDIIDVSDATGAVQSFDYSGLGTGTYTVRLDVSDGTCNNFFEQEITIYPNPPTPTFTAGSSEECTNTLISFTNTTDESQHSGIMMYKWDFDSDGIIDSTDPNPSYSYATAGVKTVVLVDSIPGCSATSATFDITINPGPTPSFFAASVCQDEAMQFNNTSINADSYFWDFGDGFTSTNENPSHIFAAAGNYDVTLTATDLDGCDASVIVEVAVSDSPQIDFDFNIPCTSVDGTQFFDLSTVDNADLVTWTWFVDDVEVSTLQSPTIVFDSEGIRTIRLDVQSSNGCESSYSEDIEVLSAPTPDFSISIGCQGEASSFMDNTPSSGNPIVSWLWTVNGVNYGTQDIDHVFNEAGSFDVTLEVTGQNFCPESITKTIEIIELPSVAFDVQGECDNQLIRATDVSTNSSDPVIAQRWMLDGENVGNGSQLVLEQLSDATYDLALELETQSGCIISSNQSLVINNAPNSSFTSSRTYGIPNDQLSFTNTSTGATTNQWLLDGNLLSTNEQTEHISFSEVGTYTVSLVTQNSLGCNDTTDQQILIAVPEVDLAIGTFELVNENNVGKIFLEVQNMSNLPVEIVEAQIVLENTFAITEQILGFIDVGATNLVSLNVGIPLTVSEPSYFCVKLISQYADYPDMEPVNNEKCITINPIVQLEDPFPNPVSDQFRLKLIVGEEGSASVSVVNSAGKVEINSIEPVSQGLNNFFIDMSLLNPGIYYVTVEVQGTTHKKKVIKL